MARSITTRSTNPKIMDDNILKLENAIEVADVSANPSGTAEETLLTTIGIDGKKYDIGASAENVSYSAGVSVKNKIDNITVKKYRLTHANFTWSEGSDSFVSNETVSSIIGNELLLGISGDFTNGAAILGWRITQGNIQIIGWIPKNGANIDSGYEFELYILTKPSA